MRLFINSVAAVGLALTCVSCSQDTGAPPLPERPLYGEVSAGDVLGCYEMLSFEWNPPSIVDELEFYAPPRRFSLARGGLVRSFDAKWVGSGSWTLVDDYTLKVIWVERSEILVRRRSTDRKFLGVAGPLSDSDVPQNRGNVTFRQVPC